MIIDLEIAHRLVQSVWEQVLGLEVCFDPAPAGVARPGGWLEGCVRVRGAWEGAIHLACPPALARRAAAAMFALSVPEVSVEETRDSLGELTNIVGGNLKALLPGPSTLGLPRVVEVLDADEADAGCPLFQAAFHCQDEPLLLTIIGPGADDREER